MRITKRSTDRQNVNYSETHFQKQFRFGIQRIESICTWIACTLLCSTQIKPLQNNLTNLCYLDQLEIVLKTDRDEIKGSVSISQMSMFS